MLQFFVLHGSDHPYADTCCFSYSVIFPCEWLLLLNSYLQSMLFGIPMLCGINFVLKQNCGTPRKTLSMQIGPQNPIDLVQIAFEHVDAHDATTWKNLSAFRAELNENHSAFGRLRLADLQSEIQLGQKLFAALLNEHGNYCFNPQVLAAGYAGHILRLETRSNLYAAMVTIFGVATAIWSIEGKDALFSILISGLLTAISLIAKLNDDKYLSLLRRVVAHLQSFSPNIAIEGGASPRNGSRPSP